MWRLVLCCHNRGATRSWERGLKEILPWCLHERECGPVDSLSLDFWPPAPWDGISVFEPFSVWRFVIAAPGNSHTPLFSLTAVLCFAILVPPLFSLHSLSLGKLIHTTASVTITILTSPSSSGSQDWPPHRRRWPFRSWPASLTGFYHSPPTHTHTHPLPALLNYL